MWQVTSSNRIIMSEGDYGVALPITLVGATLGTNDNIKLIITQDSTEKYNANLPKNQSVANQVLFSLTQPQSASLNKGEYKYSLIWYGTNFNCTLVDEADFEVR